jgi:hypothetical protein
MAREGQKYDMQNTNNRREMNCNGYNSTEEGPSFCGVMFIGKS